MSHNPYTQAAGAYGKSSGHDETDQASLEGQLLLKAAQKLQLLEEKLGTDNSPSLEEIDDVLTYNRKLWTVFADETTNDENDLPDDLKNNIASLAIFIFKQTIKIQSEPTSANITPVIDINRRIASGLLKRPKQAEQPPVDTSGEDKKQPETAVPEKNTEESAQTSSSTDMSA